MSFTAISLDQHCNYIIELFFENKQSLMLAQYLKNNFNINITSYIIE